MQILPFIFLALFPFALMTTVVANNKGRNRLGWFFIGLLLGPIGLVLSLLTTDKLRYKEKIIIQQFD